MKCIMDAPIVPVWLRLTALRTLVKLQSVDHG